MGSNPIVKSFDDVLHQKQKRTWYMNMLNPTRHSQQVDQASGVFSINGSHLVYIGKLRSKTFGKIAISGNISFQRHL